MTPWKAAGLAAAAAPMVLAVPPAQAQAPAPASAEVPSFQVDPFRPRTLPNNWIYGQVAGVAVDRRDHIWRDHIWIVHRPKTLQDRQVMGGGNAPRVACCVAAPPVLVLSVFGRMGRQAGQFLVPHNIAEDSQGNLYITEVDTGQRVQRFRRVEQQAR